MDAGGEHGVGVEHQSDELGGLRLGERQVARSELEQVASRPEPFDRKAKIRP